jgi:probable HAF family extracellular repeat protein
VERIAYEILEGTGQSEALIGSKETVMNRLVTLLVAIGLSANVVAQKQQLRPDALFRTGDGWGEVLGLNESGDVVGYFNDRFGSVIGPNRAFAFIDGKYIELGTLLDTTHSAAIAINASREVIGVSSASGPARRACVWKDGVMTELPSLGGDFSEPHDINDLGQIVGESKTASGEYHPVLWEDGKPLDLGTLSGSNLRSAANAINELGEIVGISWEVTPLPRMFRWSVATGMVDLGPLGLSGQVLGINNGGQVVGEVRVDQFGPNRPFVWDNGVLTLLEAFGVLQGQAKAINDSGEIVGFVTGSGGSHAVLWSGNQVTELPPLGGHDGAYAQAINSDGHIVCGLSVRNRRLYEIAVPVCWRTKR